MPKDALLQGWAERLPEHFAFVIKASKPIPHDMQLRECGEPDRRRAGIAQDCPRNGTARGFRAPARTALRREGGVSPVPVWRELVHRLGIEPRTC
jgi:uncharacterized protein YecE (DUF72 family)